MALNLFEYIKIEPNQDEYAVEALQKQLQNEDLKQQREELQQMQQKMLEETDEYLASIVEQVAAETDTKKQLQLKKIQTYVQNVQEKVHKEQVEKAKKQQEETATIAYRFNEFAQYWLNQEPYAESFAQAYRIKDEAFKRGDDADINFVLFSEEMDPRRMKPEGQFYKEVMTDSQPSDYFALRVDLHDGLPFNIVMEPSDRNDARTQMRIVLAPEENEPLDFENPTVAAENKSKIRKIIEFCEKYGFSTFDMHLPMTFDGKVDENAFYEESREKLNEKEKKQQEELKKAFAEVQDEIKAEHIENWQKEAAANDAKKKEIEEYATQHPEENIKVEDYSLDEVPAEHFGALTQKLPEAEAAQTSATPQNNAPTASAHATPSAPTAPISTQSAKKWSLAEVEQEMEEMLGGEGLGKIRNETYVKKGMFHSDWTEYVVYDKPYAYKDDGRRDPKTDLAQYTYAYKLFVKVDDAGNLTFSYRRNNGAKIDALVNAMAGKFQKMGITHINFPVGLPDDEKGLWRKALAEKGIVYKGMGIDVDKAEGMIKAAKDKHMATDDLIMFKYRIALQMQENNANKGKTPGTDESAFIDGLINTYHYRGFTNGYALGLKSLINRTLIAGDADYGAVNKIAAYRALRQVFDVYKELLRCKNVENLRVGTIDEIINTANPQEENRQQVFVTPAQKQKLLALNLGSDISKITPEQLTGIYKALLPEQTETAKTEVYKVLDDFRLKDIKVIGAKIPQTTLVRNIFNEAKKSVDAINSDNLVAMGVDEISLPKDGQVSLGIGAYIKKVEAEEIARRAEEARAATSSTPARGSAGTPARADTSRGAY